MMKQRESGDAAFRRWANNYERYLFMEYREGRCASNSSACAPENVRAEMNSVVDAILESFNGLTKGNRPGKQEARLFARMKLFAISTLEGLYGKDPESVLKNAYEIGLAKNHDYGTDNITRFGVVGLLTRTNDKVCRVITLVGKKENHVKDERLEDTLLDIVNYATYGLMLTDGVWE